MPLYDYRCPNCQHQFETRHGFFDDAPSCPNCAFEEVTRIISSAPSHAKGMEANAGDSRGASKEQLKDKWREETPKLQKKLRDKLGDDAVKSIPSLNMNYD